MSLIEIFVIGASLSMDAFAVSICKGLSVKKLKIKNALICGIWFGFFQALMPLLGYYLGNSFKGLIDSIDHWIAFILLAIIGINMIREAFSEGESGNDDFSFKTMLPLAVATSIDAFAVGVSFSFLNVNIYESIAIIGVTTFAFSLIGVKLGHLFGDRFQSKAEIAGGVVLVIMAIKILVQGLMS